MSALKETNEISQNNFVPFGKLFCIKTTKKSLRGTTSVSEFKFKIIKSFKEEKINFDDYCVDKKKKDELFNQFQNHFMSNFHSKIHEYIKSKNCRSITSASPYVDAEIARKLKLPDNNYWKAINLLF